MEKLAGPIPKFDFREYSIANPYQPERRTLFRAARSSPWTLCQIKSSATRKDLDRWRARFHVPSDVSLYVPAEDERVDQPPKGMVVVNETIMGVGLRFPLPFAVSYLLNAWNVAPLQLTPNAWLQIVCTLTLFGATGFIVSPRR